MLPTRSCRIITFNRHQYNRVVWERAFDEIYNDIKLRSNNCSVVTTSSRPTIKRFNVWRVEITYYDDGDGRNVPFEQRNIRRRERIFGTYTLPIYCRLRICALQRHCCSDGSTWNMCRCDDKKLEKNKNKNSPKCCLVYNNMLIIYC